MTEDALDFLGTALDVLWLGLALAIGIWVAAALWVVVRFVGARLERRYLPSVARWSRRRAGVAEDAGPWACPICHSVNPPTVSRCYACGVVRPSDAPELTDAAVDPTIFHRPEPPNRFDPSLYRGPGAAIAAAVPAGGSGAPDALLAPGAPGASGAPDALGAPGVLGASGAAGGSQPGTAGHPQPQSPDAAEGVQTMPADDA